MINQPMLDYIKQQLEQGVSYDRIRMDLLTNGWSGADVNEAFNAVPKPAPIITPQVPVIPVLDPTLPPTAAASPKSAKNHFFISLAASILVLAIVSGVGYAYYKKLGPFSSPPYSEDNLLSGLLTHISLINTSAYSLSGSLTTSARDAGAMPFVPQIENEEQRALQYKNDYQRAQDISSLLMSVDSYMANMPGSHVKVPSTIEDASKISPYSSKIKDPATGVKYSYVTVNEGEDFNLKVTFETGDAISNISNSIKSFEDKSTIISGQTVTFTKDSKYNFGYYFSPEPPKSFFSQLQDMAAYAPAEIAVSTSISAATNWMNSDADWKLNIDTTGDFGDLIYKANIDALKKGGSYYLRINNFPGIFGFPPASLKGVWAKIDPTEGSSTSTASSYAESSYITSYASVAETEYKKNRADLQDLLKKIVAVADKTHLISFMNTPKSEQINGRTLYRYDLQINKAGLIPFYNQMAEQVGPQSSFADTFNNPSTANYLRGNEFSQIFDYYNKNTTLTLWVDADGFPALVKYSIRIVPPDTATLLTGKQLNLISQLSISDINQPIDISTPSDARPINELMNGSMSSSQAKGRDAKRIADLGSIQQGLALFFDSDGKYPTSLKDLVTAKLLPSVPVEPNPNESYSYAASPDNLSYHLGATLEQIAANTGVLASDRDCSSLVDGSPLCPGFSKGVTNGFNGRDAESCSGTGTGTCYDVTP